MMRGSIQNPEFRIQEAALRQAPFDKFRTDQDGETPGVVFG